MQAPPAGMQRDKMKPEYQPRPQTYAKAKKPEFVKDRAAAGVQTQSWKQTSPKEVRPPLPPAPIKVAIRRLSPLFNGEDFMGLMTAAMSSALASERALNWSVLHYSPGKISKKRGKITGIGYIVVDRIDGMSPSQIIDVIVKAVNDAAATFDSHERADPDSTRPQVELAPYQRVFRFRSKLRRDTFEGTYEKDPDFRAFCIELETPIEKLPSADVQLDQRLDEKADAKPISALVLYLRERRTASRSRSSRGAPSESRPRSGRIRNGTVLSRLRSGGRGSSSQSTSEARNRKSGSKVTSRKSPSRISKSGETMEHPSHQQAPFHTYGNPPMQSEADKKNNMPPGQIEPRVKDGMKQPISGRGGRGRGRGLDPPIEPGYRGEGRGGGRGSRGRGKGGGRGRGGVKSRENDISPVQAPKLALLSRGSASNGGT